MIQNGCFSSEHLRPSMPRLRRCAEKVKNQSADWIVCEPVLATLDIRSGNKRFENDISFFHCLETREGKGKIRNRQAIFIF